MSKMDYVIKNKQKFIQDYLTGDNVKSLARKWGVSVPYLVQYIMPKLRNDGSIDDKIESKREE